MKRIALTFDDGPDIETTPRLLEILTTYNVKASFMIWGQHAVKFPELIKLIHYNGYAIGSHSFTHQDLTKLDNTEIVSEMARTDAILNEIIDEIPSFYRPPYGSINREVASLIDKAAIVWSLDSQDWKIKEKLAIYQRVTRNVKDGDIILMHDLQPMTILALEDILQFFKNQNFELVTVPELFDQKLQPHQIYYNRTNMHNLEV